MDAPVVDRLGRLDPMPFLAVTLVLVALVGMAEYSIGSEVSLSAFYLAPVCFSAWYRGWWYGASFSLASALAWLAADVATGHTYSHVGLLFWNGAVRLAFFLQSAYLVSQLRDHLASERRLARMDPATGILNARGLDEAAQPLLALSRRAHSPLTMLYIDLDNFKEVNDSFGHAEGDRLLKLVADALTRSIRQSDLAARLGGDEFAVVLPATDSAGARAIVERLRHHVREGLAPHQSVTVSIGAATFADPPSTLTEAIKAADRLMYEVKNGGKNAAAFETLASVPQPPDGVRPARP